MKKIAIDFYSNYDKEIEEFTNDLSLLFLGNEDISLFTENIFTHDGLNYHGGGCEIKLMHYHIIIYYANDDKLLNSEKVPYKYTGGIHFKHIVSKEIAKGIFDYITELLKLKNIILEEVTYREYEPIQKIRKKE